VALVLLQSPSLSKPAIVDDSWFEEAGGLQQNQQHHLFFSLIKFTIKKILQGSLTFSTRPLLHIRCKSHPCAAPCTWKCHPIHPVSKEQSKSITNIQRKHVCFLKGMSSTSSRFMQQCNILEKISWWHWSCCSPLASPDKPSWTTAGSRRRGDCSKTSNTTSFSL
jgi:hypothetical protein